jgi:DNA-binding transcriptional LysR family regulator
MAFDPRLLSGIGVMIAVVEEGSFTRAADALRLTPSGISRAIARLEAQVGVRLFHRTPRSVELTEDGRRFHAEVAPLLSGIEEAAESAAGSASEVRGRLRVNVDPWFARIVLAPRLPELMAGYPRLSLDLSVSNHREQMMAGGVDVAVRFGAPEGSTLIARKLLETRIVTCASPDYLARRGAPATPADVSEHEALLFRDPQSGSPFTWEFHRAGRVVEARAAGRVVMDDPSAALAACEAGLGLFQSFDLGLAPRFASGRLVQVLADWSDERFPLYAYYPSRRQAPAKVRVFLEFVSAICADPRDGARS